VTTDEDELYGVGEDPYAPALRPGRLCGELLSRGVFTLGVDIAPRAVTPTTALGGLALCRSVFDRLPAGRRFCSPTATSASEATLAACCTCPCSLRARLHTSFLTGRETPGQRGSE
jgi:hypothetical protein